MILKYKHCKDQNKLDILKKKVELCCIFAARDARCLFVKNLPYNATKEDILKIFHKAIAIRFPGGTEGPTQG